MTGNEETPELIEKIIPTLELKPTTGILRCKKCLADGHLIKKCTKTICYTCRQGHKTVDCKFNTWCQMCNDEKCQGIRYCMSKIGIMRRTRCSKCRRIGHIAFSCPKFNQTKKFGKKRK